MPTFFATKPGQKAGLQPRLAAPRYVILWALDRYALVLIGAAIGGLARYLASIAITQRLGGRFPIGTLIVNVSGCFAIGILMTLFSERLKPHPNWQPFLVVGVLGGYTTFSSFGWETYLAVRQGYPWLGLANVALSVILGYLAVWLGAVLVRR